MLNINDKILRIYLTFEGAVEGLFGNFTMHIIKNIPTSIV